MFSAITALPHRLTEALIHVALVTLGIEEEVSELQGHVRVCEGHVVEEGVFGGHRAGCEAGFVNQWLYLGGTLAKALRRADGYARTTVDEGGVLESSNRSIYIHEAELRRRLRVERGSCVCERRKRQ